MPTSSDSIHELANQEYKYGFVTDIETESIPKGLNEGIIRLISEKKSEPQWMLDWRLKAYRYWKKRTEPRWPKVEYPEIDYQDIIYYSAPKQKVAPKSLEEFISCITDSS